MTGQPTVPTVVGVLGGGRMRSGIEQVFAVAGSMICLVERDPRSTDLVGLDVRLAIAEHLHRELGERFAPPPLLRDKVARGELGRKTGQGFFTWEAA